MGYLGYIYTISRSDNGSVFYVGSTMDFDRRVYDHLLKSNKSKVGDMIRFLDKQKVKPIFKKIDCCYWLDRFDIERIWIQKYRLSGSDLINNVNHKKIPVEFNEIDEVNFNLSKKSVLYLSEIFKHKNISFSEYIDNLLLKEINSLTTKANETNNKPTPKHH